MSTHNPHEQTAREATISSYVVGFALSILLTLAAFALVYAHTVWSHTLFSQTVLYSSLLVCALVQLFVQIFFFLHGGKSKGHWNQTALAFALVVVTILVAGTLWIMQNLQHGNMPEPFEDGIVTPQTEA